MENCPTKFRVLIPDAESRHAASVIDGLGTSGEVDIYLMSTQKYPAIRFSRYVKGYNYHPPTDEIAEWLDHIDREVEQNQIDLIMPVFEIAIKHLVNHKESLKYSGKLLPLPNPDALSIALDKSRIAEFMECHNIPGPRSIKLNDNISHEAIAGKLRFPLLAKPSLVSGGGMGIAKLPDQYSLTKFLQQWDNSQDYILQEFIAGYDMGCSVLCNNGQILACTIQKGTLYSNKPYSPQIGLNFVEESSVRKIVGRLMKLLNWSGIANIDMVYDIGSGGCKILEINPRYWSTLDASMLAGVNFPLLYCYLGLGKPLPVFKHRLISCVSLKGLRFSIYKQPAVFLRPKYLYNNTSLQYAFKDPIPMAFHYAICFGKLFSSLAKKAKMKLLKPSNNA